MKSKLPPNSTLIDMINAVYISRLEQLRIIIGKEKQIRVHHLRVQHWFFTSRSTRNTVLDIFDFDKLN